MTNKLVNLVKNFIAVEILLTVFIFLILVFEDTQIIHCYLTIYSISILIFLIFIVVATILHLKNLDTVTSNKKITKFIKTSLIYFICLNLLSLIFKYYNINLFIILSISVGTSYVVTFLDLLLSKKK